MTSEIDANGYDKNNEKVRATGSWITNEFLEEILRNHEKDNDIKVIKSDVCAAVGVGDNYLSTLYRTSVEYVRKTDGDVEKLQLMIKGAPTAKILIQMIENVGIFKKELAMYNECLPGMKGIMEEYMPDETMFIAADSYRCSLPNTIVMQDLKVLGYQMGNRRQQLDWDHSIVVLRALARFHALSVKLGERDPDLIKKVSYDMYQESNREQMESYMSQSFPAWASAIEEYGGCERFIPLIHNVNKKLFDKVLYMIQPNGALNVLNHGDSWTNNFLFKYDSEGNVVHVKLVDFQLCRYTSPAMDVLYFIFTSPHWKIVTERMFDLIRVYHEALMSDLEKLQLDSSVYTLEQLHDEIRGRSLFGLFVMAGVTPICLAKPTEALDMDGFDPDKVKPDDEYPLMVNFRDSHYKQVVIAYLNFFEESGLFKEAEERFRFIDERAAAANGQKSDEEVTQNEIRPAPTELVTSPL